MIQPQSHMAVPGEKTFVRFGLKRETQLMDLPTHDLVLECLTADAMRELEAGHAEGEEAARKKV